jgi:hypothetical protein
MWDKLTNAQKVLTFIGSAVITTGTLYGAFSVFRDRSDKLKEAVTHKEVIEMFGEVKNNMDVMNDSLSFIIKKQKESNMKINENFVTIKNELIKQKREDKSITESQKLDDILRLVEGISVDVKMKDKEQIPLRIKIEKNDKNK